MSNSERHKQTLDLLTVMFAPGSLMEVWGRHAGGTSRVLTDDLDLAAHAGIKMCDDLKADVYCRLNPIDAGSEYAKRTELNRMFRRVPNVAGDCAITRRSNYLVEVDPVRGIDEKCCASDAEKASAWAVTQAVHQYLMEQGFPEPFMLDSGNGYHLLFRGDGCNPKSEYWAFVLRHLSERFDTESAKVDIGIGDPKRSFRIPGTWNRKGTDAPERPHRMVSLIQRPPVYEQLIHGRIYQLATKNGFEGQEYAPPSASSPSESNYELVVDEDGLMRWIEEYPDHLHCLSTRRNGEEILFILDECPFKGGRHRGHKPVIILHPNGDLNSIGFNCFSDDCAGYTFNDLRAHLIQETGHIARTKLWKCVSQEDDEDIQALAHKWGGIDDLAEDSDRHLSHVECTDASVQYGDTFGRVEMDMRTLSAVAERVRTGNEPVEMGGGWMFVPPDYVSPRLLKHKNDIIEFEHLTFEHLMNPFREVTAGELMLLTGWNHTSFREWIEEVVMYEDVYTMARYLGAEMVADLEYHRCPNPAKDARFAVRAQETETVLRWFGRPAHDIVGLTFDDLVPALREEAIRRDGMLTDQGVAEWHRWEVESIIRRRDLARMAAYLSPTSISEVRECCGI